MPSAYLDILRRRVTHVEGGVVELQRLLLSMAAEERQQAARLGTRTPWYTQIPSVLPGGAGDLIRLGYHSWGSWAEFDRTWAARIGPKVRDVASRVAKFEELGLPTSHQRWPGPVQGEEATTRNLLVRGNTASNQAELQASAWVNSPAGAQDERTSPWHQRWMRRATRGTLLEWASGLVSGTRSGERFAAEFWLPGERRPLATGGGAASTGRQGTVEEALVAGGIMRPTTPGQEHLAPRADAPDRGGDENGGGTNWFSIAVTAALVVAGGYLVVRIAQGMMNKDEEPAAEAEEA